MWSELEKKRRQTKRDFKSRSLGMKSVEYKIEAVLVIIFLGQRLLSLGALKYLFYVLLSIFRCKPYTPGFSHLEAY